MAENYFHGVRTEIRQDGRPSFSFAGQGTIGLVAKTSTGIDPKKLHSVRSEAGMKALIKAGEDKDTDTLVKSLRSIFLQCDTEVVIAITDGTKKGTVDAIALLKKAPSILQLYPKILCCTDYAGLKDSLEAALVNGAPVSGRSDHQEIAEALMGAAKAFGGSAIIEVTAKNETEALTFRKGLTGASGYAVYPRLNLSGIGTVGASAATAGHIARIRSELGYWVSPSNQKINGVVGLEIPVEWFISESSESTRLNEAGISTFVGFEGFRLWGNRTTAGADDPSFKFINVYTTANAISEEIARKKLSAVDKNINKAFIKETLEDIRDYMRGLKRVGAIIGGEVWFDPEANQSSDLANGKTVFDFAFTAPAPAEEIKIRVTVTDIYYAEVLAA